MFIMLLGPNKARIRLGTREIDELSLKRVSLSLYFSLLVAEAKKHQTYV